MVTFLKPHKVIIDIGNKEINAVYGNPNGLPSGKMYELAGVEHAGKTTWSLILAGMAQRQHKAIVLWIDLESSWSYTYARSLGVSCKEKNFYLIKPLVVKFSKIAKGGSKKLKARKKMKTFLQSIEWSFKEAEEVMAYFKTKYPDRPIFVCCDSVANMQTEEQFVAGATDQNMATNQARAQFLSRNLPRWTQLAENYDAWMVFINQIRSNPAMAFGDPEYTPGGKALAHNAHSRVWLRKLKGGKLLKNGKVVGLKGKAINKKNKVGGGSTAYLDYGFQISFNKPIEKALKFLSIKSAEKD